MLNFFIILCSVKVWKHVGNVLKSCSNTVSSFLHFLFYFGKIAELLTSTENDLKCILTV